MCALWNSLVECIVQFGLHFQCVAAKRIHGRHHLHPSSNLAYHVLIYSCITCTFARVKMYRSASGSRHHLHPPSILAYHLPTYSCKMYAYTPVQVYRWASTTMAAEQFTVYDVLNCKYPTLVSDRLASSPTRLSHLGFSQCMHYS